MTDDPLNAVREMLLAALIDSTQYDDGKFKGEHDINALLLPESTFKLVVQTPGAKQTEFVYSKFDLGKLAEIVEAYYAAKHTRTFGGTQNWAVAPMVHSPTGFDQ